MIFIYMVGNQIEHPLGEGVIPKNCIRCKKPRGKSYFLVVFCENCIKDKDIKLFLKIEGE